MKKTLTLTAAVLMVVLLCASCGAKAPTSWTSDYNAAIETAKKDGSSILLYISGYDEEGVCENLTNTIMTSKTFLDAAKGFIAVKLDVDLNADPDDAVQNEILEIGGRLGLQYYPTIVCITSDEKVFADIFFDPEYSSLESMTSDMKDAAETAKTVAKLNKTIAKSTGVEKAKAIDTLLKTIPQDYFNQYADLAMSIPELDPENKSGIVGTYKMLLAYNDSMAYLFSGDLENAIGVFTDLAADPYLTADDVQQCYFYTASMCYYVQSWEQCFAFLQKAYDAAPESENAALIANTLTQLQSELESSMTGGAE